MGFELGQQIYVLFVLLLWRCFFLRGGGGAWYLIAKVMIFVYPQSVLVHPEKKIMISTETQFCFVFNILETLFFRLRYSYYRFLFVLLLCFCEDLYSNCRQNCVYPFFDCSFTSHLFSLVFFTSLHLLYHHYFRFGFFFS